MKTEVAAAIDELKRQFSGASVTPKEDGHGGAYVIVEPVSLSNRFTPNSTWLGFHIPPSYPYADIYPVFIGNEVARADGKNFEPPVTRGHNFQGRSGIQISRRNGSAETGLQKATAKILKVLYYLEQIP
jgi:hypothetical protein